jgi:hypothetical protein
MELKLGQKVSFDTVYLRFSKSVKSKHCEWTRTRRYKYWKKYHCDKKEGIVVGLRTLSNGETHYDCEDGYYYTRTESVPAVLVSISLRYSILKVPLEDIKLED